jgi:hypothetical protein
MMRQFLARGGDSCPSAPPLLLHFESSGNARPGGRRARVEERRGRSGGGTAFAKEVSADESAGDRGDPAVNLWKETHGVLV